MPTRFHQLIALTRFLRRTGSPLRRKTLSLAGPLVFQHLVAVVPPGLGYSSAIARFCRGSVEHVPIRQPVRSLVPVRDPITAGTDDAVERLAGADQLRTAGCGGDFARPGAR